MNPYVFIVGCPRSGTTVLQRVVNAHPQLAILNQFFLKVNRWAPKSLVTPERLAHRSPDGLVNPGRIAQLLQCDKLFRKLHIHREDLERMLGPGAPVSYAGLITTVFDLYGRSQGKNLVGDKTPIYVRSIRTLHRLWPETRFVHLIRDGRDVCLSTINWKRKAAQLAKAFATWREDAVSTAAMRWRWNVELGREAGLALGARLYYELRYEALVARPAEECARLCAFLGIPYDEAMLHFHEGRTKNDPKLDAKRSWRPITPGLRDWRTQMSAADVEHFEAAAGDLLEELSYPRAVPSPRAEALRNAARVRKLFVEDLRARRKVLPERL